MAIIDFTYTKSPTIIEFFEKVEASSKQGWCFLGPGVDIEIIESAGNWLDVRPERFGIVFPTTKVFSVYALETLPKVLPIDDPDTGLVQYMDQEELLFRTDANPVSAMQAGF